MSALLTRRRLLAGMAALPVAAMTTAANGGKADISLAAAAARSGRFFAAAARIDQIEREPALREALLHDCSHLTPEIDLKWGALEPRLGELAVRPALDLAAFALDNGLKLRGHTLLWHDSVPRWAAERLVHERDWRLVQRYFAAVVPRFGTSIEQWEVVNEPIDPGHRADGLRPNLFLQAFGPDYIRRALEETRLLAPSAQIMINEYGLDYDFPVERERRRLFLRLVEKLKRSGAPLDGVGIQAHLDLSKGPFSEKALASFLHELAGFGLRIAITEMDVKEADRTASMERRDAAVAEITRRYLDVALAERAVDGVATWGLSDRHSWLQDRLDERPASSAALNRGLPYDHAMRTKPMHRAIREAFMAASSRVG